MTSRRDRPAFPCLVGIKPAPCPRLGWIRLSKTLQVWPSPARPRCRTRGASPACTAEPCAPRPGTVWVPWPCSHLAFSLSRQRATSNVPIVSTPGWSQCAEEPSSSSGVSLMYGWGEGQEISAVWAISPFWHLPLLPFFVSFPRKAWDRHGASASYEAWDSRLPSSSLKLAGEPQKAEIAQVQGLCGLQRPTQKAQTFKNPL